MTLDNFNSLNTAEKTAALRHCCGSQAWVDRMLIAFPYADVSSLLAAASQCWHQCKPTDWLEAFGHHPKIGAATSDKAAASEQLGTATATTDVLQRLAAGNKQYEERFGYIYIVCATGRSGPEMLAILESRLGNDPDTELRIAMAEQEKITLLRLKKILA